MLEAPIASATAALSLSGSPRNKSRCGGSRSASHARAAMPMTASSPNMGRLLAIAGWRRKSVNRPRNASKPPFVRNRVVEGKSVLVRVDSGGALYLHKKQQKTNIQK